MTIFCIGGPLDGQEYIANSCQSRFEYQWDEAAPIPVFADRLASRMIERKRLTYTIQCWKTSDSEHEWLLAVAEEAS